MSGYQWSVSSGGTITGLISDSLLTVIWDSETKLPSGQNFILGEKVKAIGEWQEEEFELSYELKMDRSNSKQNI